MHELYVYVCYSWECNVELVLGCQDKGILCRYYIYLGT